MVYVPFAASTKEDIRKRFVEFGQIAQIYYNTGEGRGWFQFRMADARKAMAASN